MESPYEKSIRERLEAEGDPVKRAILVAEQAGYLARTGQFAQAEATLAEVRRHFGDGRSGHVAVMLMCAEGLLAYFRDLDPQSYDRLARAQLLSIAAKNASLSALTSAWLAHIAFNLHRHDDMARAVRTCMQTLTADDLQAKCRISLTLGDAFLVLDEEAIARRWYAEARELAVRLGDHSALSALIYNQAALAVFNCRLGSLDRAIETQLVRDVASKVRSATNFQGLAQLRSLQHLLDDAQASILILEGRFDEALRQIERVLGASIPISPSGHTVTALCDMAMCYASMGRRDDFNRTISEIDMSELERRTADDRAVAFAALRDAYLRFGQQHEAQHFDQQMNDSLVEHRNRVSSLRTTLDPYQGTPLIQ